MVCATLADRIEIEIGICQPHGTKARALARLSSEDRRALLGCIFNTDIFFLAYFCFTFYYLHAALHGSDTTHMTTCRHCC